MSANQSFDFPAASNLPPAEDPGPFHEIALRDLSDAQFRARYNSDRFTAAMLASRMRTS